MVELTLAIPEAAGVSAVFLLPGLPSPRCILTFSPPFLMMEELSASSACLKGVVLTHLQDSPQPEDDGRNAAGHKFQLRRETHQEGAVNGMQCLACDADAFLDSAEKSPSVKGTSAVQSCPLGSLLNVQVLPAQKRQ